MKNIHKVLEEHFGYDEFRPGQEDPIRSILSGKDTVCIMKTGGGKSVIFQIPAIILDGTMIVITPLKSLMRDQVTSARKHGIKAGHIDGDMEQSDQIQFYKDLETGIFDIVYVSPERFFVNRFTVAIKKMKISALVWDEFHTASDWSSFRRSLKRLPKQVAWIKAPRLGFTATATEELQNELIRDFGFRDPKIFKSSFDRPNLYYEVVNKVSDGTRQIREFIEDRPGEAGIVYCCTRDDTEHTSALLNAYDIKCDPYHAGLSKGLRLKTQDAFIRGDINVITATIAFGMGIDHPNVRWVIHKVIPKSISGYSQETGRSGRDGKPSHCMLLYRPNDLNIVWNMVSKSNNPKEKKDFDNIKNFVTRSICRRKTLLRHFGEEYEGNCGNCDVCLKKHQAGIGNNQRKKLFGGR